MGNGTIEARRYRRIWAAATVALLPIFAVTGCGQSSSARSPARSAITVSGSVEMLSDNPYAFKISAGGPCNTLLATDSSAQSLAGTQIAILNSSGALVGQVPFPNTGVAEPAAPNQALIQVEYKCRFSFRVTGVPAGNGQYQLRAGNLPAYPFTRSKAASLLVVPFDGQLSG
ncbi:MAG: hypothetical protein JWP74_1527 [Marmoricola sp.]|nr:hypothetical protein [Marmoricola sp.]